MAKKVVTSKEFAIEDFYFLDAHYKKAAQFFIDNGSSFLFALSVDYPGLYEIPMEYLDKAKAELKVLGFKTFNSSRNTKSGVPHYRIFYLGPRRTLHAGTMLATHACSTRKSDARAFRIFIYSLGGK
jgi:hypothetical protein